MKKIICKLESDLISKVIFHIFPLFLMLAFIESFIKIALEQDENTQQNVT